MVKLQHNLTWFMIANTKVKSNLVKLSHKTFVVIKTTKVKSNLVKVLYKITWFIIITTKPKLNGLNYRTMYIGLSLP